MPKRTVTATIDTDKAASYLQDKSHPLHGVADLNPLMERIGDARIVMLGEASHGTHEYYTWRSHISKRLIQEKGFNFIAVEGDWPDCYKVNRYIKNYTDIHHAPAVLKEFNRWPTWMWANWEIAALSHWLNQYNKGLPGHRKAGFYGLDVYSLWESMEAVMQYLAKVDPHTLKMARKAFECFEPYRGEEGFRYASALRLVPELCEMDVINLLAEIQRKMPTYDHDYEAAFSVEQNALVAVNAEGYYRAMLQGGGSSWNARDRHMEETLERLLEFHGPKSKAIIWAHNTHIGDASFTDMADAGMYNIGELARKRFGENDVVLVGFGSYEGTVIAGSEWGAKMEVKEVPKAKRDSFEFMLHLAGPENKLLLMNELNDNMLRDNYVGHRAIGVVYNPEYEHYGNYVPSILPRRYDAFLFIDKTHALYPLHIKPDGSQTPETYPFGV